MPITEFKTRMHYMTFEGKKYLSSEHYQFIANGNDPIYKQSLSAQVLSTFNLGFLVVKETPVLVVSYFWAGESGQVQPHGNHAIIVHLHFFLDIRVQNTAFKCKQQWQLSLVDKIRRRNVGAYCYQ